MGKKGFWIIAIGLHCLFFLIQVLGPTTMLQDSKEYLFAADNLLNAHQLYCWDLSETFNPDYLTKRPFLFPSILALIKFLSFGNSKLFVIILLILQNLISLFNLKLMLKFVFHFTEKFNFKMAIILLILTPAQIIYANLIMSEIWLQLVIILTLNYFIFYRDNPKWQFIGSLLCIAGMALKPVYIFWVLLFPLFTIYNNRKKMRLKLIGFTLLPLLFFVFTLQWNEQRTGMKQYSSISTINLLHYNAYTLLIHEKGIHKADSIIDDISLRASQQNAYKQQQVFKNNAANALIKANLGTYFYLHMRGVVLCVLDPGRFDITQFFHLPHTQNLVYESSKKNNLNALLNSFRNPLGLILIGLLIFNFIKLIIAIRFVFLKDISIANKFLMLLFPIYILMLTGPIGSSRFAMPIMPIYLGIILISLSAKKQEVNP